MKHVVNQILMNNLQRIDLFHLGRLFVELILFVIVIRVINKTYHLFFDKLISRIEDFEMRKNYETLRHLGIYIIDSLIVLFFAINVLEAIGVDMKPVLATAGVFGVAIGFGGKKFVEDLISGLSIILTGQVRVGDFVTVNNSTGTVEKVTLTMITIRAYNGDVHYLRNGQIDTIINQTKNYSFPLFRVSVAYKTDVAQAMKALKEAGQELRENPEYSKFVLSDLEVLGLDEFQDSAIIILCRIKTTPQEQWMIKRKFNQMIKEKFERVGIEIPFPQIVVTQNEEKTNN